MLHRVLEVEVMDTPEEAVDYDAMDHSAVNRQFVDDFLRFWQSRSELRESPAPQFSVLDVGTGTAQIPIELCARSHEFHVSAVDLAAHMLELGRQNVARAGLQSAIRLEQVDAKGLPYPDSSFDAVISNSIVHHIPEPRLTVAEMLRVLRPGGALFVRDLFRPPDAATLSHLVETYAAAANPHQRQMFADSLHAALTVEEVAALLQTCGTDPNSVRATSDRHWTVASWK